MLAGQPWTPKRVEPCGLVAGSGPDRPFPGADGEAVLDDRSLRESEIRAVPGDAVAGRIRDARKQAASVVAVTRRVAVLIRYGRDLPTVVDYSRLRSRIGIGDQARHAAMPVAERRLATESVLHPREDAVGRVRQRLLDDRSTAARVGPIRLDRQARRAVEVGARREIVQILVAYMGDEADDPLRHVVQIRGRLGAAVADRGTDFRKTLLTRRHRPRVACQFLPDELDALLPRHRLGDRHDAFAVVDSVIEVVAPLDRAAAVGVRRKVGAAHLPQQVLRAVIDQGRGRPRSVTDLGLEQLAFVLPVLGAVGVPGPAAFR